MAQVLRYGLRKNFAVISFLIVSTAEYCEKISQGLLNSASGKKQRILIHRCESVGEVIATHKNLHVDFIVFAIDSRLTLSLKEVEKNILLVDQSFILLSSTCLVNGNNISSNAMGVTQDQILEVCDKYNLRLLNSNVNVPEDCLYLGDQIINLSCTVLGQRSGLPLLNIRDQHTAMYIVDDSVA